MILMNRNIIIAILAIIIIAAAGGISFAQTSAAADGNKQKKYDDEGRYRIYNPEDSFVGIYTYKAETDDFKPVKIFME